MAILGSSRRNQTPYISVISPKLSLLQPFQCWWTSLSSNTQLDFWFSNRVAPQHAAKGNSALVYGFYGVLSCSSWPRLWVPPSKPRNQVEKKWNPAVLGSIIFILINMDEISPQVENFFCMGSPLAVFLALRGIRPGTSGSQDHILPRTICNRLLNIFHPTDPVVSL